MDNNNRSEFPNMDIIKGSLAVIFGLMFIVFGCKVVLQVFFLIVGTMLVYYGLKILKFHQATNYIDQFIIKLKNLFPR